jgi:hypothetical protein
MTKAEMIADLITDKFSGFKDGDEHILEACADARLVEFRSAAASHKVKAEERTNLETENRNVTARLTVAGDRLRAAEATLTEEEFLNRAPMSIKSLVEGHRAAEQAERTSIITQLKDFSVDTEEVLNKKSVEELRTLAKYAHIEVPDFSGRGLPRNETIKNLSSYDPPDPYAAGLKARRESKSVN